MARVVQARRPDRPLRRLGPDHRRKRHRQGGDGEVPPLASSKRAGRAFISVNCAAIPENLLESELFGHEKGAFTGAIARRIGKFEEAIGGTLLLDEITEMDVRLQAKLLRAIQEREIDRVGGTKPVPVDIRIIATSNRNLAEAVREGSFREDLLFRLNVVNLRLPPLRERPGDIAALAEHFVEKYAKANGLPPRRSPPRPATRCCARRGRATSASSRTPCTAPCCCRGGDDHRPRRHRPARRHRPHRSRRHGRRLATQAAQTAETISRAMVGRTVADVERDLILDTLDHCSATAPTPPTSSASRSAPCATS